MLTVVELNLWGILQSQDHEYKQRFYHGNNKIWRPNQWKGQVFQVRVIRLKTWLYSELSLYFILRDRHKQYYMITHILVIAMSSSTWFWIFKCEKPHAFWDNKHERCKQFKCFMSTMLQTKKLRLLWNSYWFSPKIKLRIFWKFCM